MVKVLLKANPDDAGTLAVVSDLNVSDPHVLIYEGEAYAKSPVPEALRLCGSCNHLKLGSLLDPDASRWYCGVDSKEIPLNGSCRNGGFAPELVVYRRVKRIRVELEQVPADPVTSRENPTDVGPAEQSADVTEVTVRRGGQKLGRRAYLAAALFFMAALMGTIWVLQWTQG